MRSTGLCGALRLVPRQFGCNDAQLARIGRPASPRQLSIIACPLRRAGLSSVPNRGVSMLEFFLRSPHGLARARSSSAGPYLDDFAVALRELGYCRRIGAWCITYAVHLGLWATANDVSLKTLDDESLTAFLAHLPRWGIGRLRGIFSGLTARGRAWRRSSSQCSNGSTGSTTDDCSSRSVTFHRRSSKRCTTKGRNVRPERSNSTKRVSGNPGAVHGSLLEWLVLLASNQPTPIGVGSRRGPG
jgi:hypothetical protein